MSNISRSVSSYASKTLQLQDEVVHEWWLPSIWPQLFLDLLSVGTPPQLRRSTSGRNWTTAKANRSVQDREPCGPGYPRTSWPLNRVVCKCWRHSHDKAWSIDVALGTEQETLFGRLLDAVEVCVCLRCLGVSTVELLVWLGSCSSQEESPAWMGLRYAALMERRKE